MEWGGGVGGATDREGVDRIKSGAMRAEGLLGRLGKTASVRKGGGRAGEMRRRKGRRM